MTSKSIFSLSFNEAKDFLLKSKSYFNADLPPYFDFATLLSQVETALSTKKIADICIKQANSTGKLKPIYPSSFESVNHTILTNKDGKYSWRPLQLIHPVLYVDLVREITTEANWERLKGLLSNYASNEKICCLSHPAVSLSKNKDKAEQVTNWWQHIELKSIELALDFSYFYETDISDCYGSIYTHSLAWAVEGKAYAKVNQQEANLGNFIDRAIQGMQFGQTNGIPQGSVLMDLIAEILLAYIDSELSSSLTANHIADYKILRYRDDYRIFVNSSEVGEKILKLLMEILASFGLRLNSTKTSGSANIVISSIKDDKLAWLNLPSNRSSLIKQALLIKTHSDNFPNSGSVTTALAKFHQRVKNLVQIQNDSLAVVSAIVDIGFKNPKTYPACFAIVSKFLSLLEVDERSALIARIKNKFSKTPNIGYMEIWLQRATKEDGAILFNEPLCNIVKGNNIAIWNSDWLEDAALKNILATTSIVNQQQFTQIQPVIESSEFNLFVQSL